MVRLLTYNVHSCIGTDGRLEPRRIADVIAASGAEIVALQELDVHRARTGSIDQAETIALALGMKVHFHPALRVVEEAYGDAILSTLPLRLVKAGALPGRAYGQAWEPRGALWVAIDAGGAELQVVNTHLGLLPREQRAQLECLLGPDWLGHPDCRDPSVLVGDFNAPVGTATYRRLAAALADAQRTPGLGRARPTFPSRWPILRIDHAFTRGPVRIAGVEVIATPLARRASDHLPLAVDLEVAPAATPMEPGSRPPVAEEGPDRPVPATDP